MQSIPNFTSEHVPRPEDVDVLTLDDRELLEYVSHLQSETRWLRQLIYEALARVSKQTDDLARAARIIEHQRRELRSLRTVAA